MGFSSVIGASSVIRPGVCTSTTRPSSPYDGQVIYETDTKRTLVYASTAWVSLTDADTPPGLQLIKSQTVGTAVSSVTVSDVFSSEFDNYRVVVSNVDSPAAGNWVHITYGSATTSYYGSFYVDRYGGTTTTYRMNNAVNMYFAWTDPDQAMNLSLDVYNPFIAGRTTWSGQGFGYDASYWFSGMHAGSSSFTSFTLTPSSTTLTGGTIRVYGYRNS